MERLKSGVLVVRNKRFWLKRTLFYANELVSLLSKTGRMAGQN